VRNFPALPTMVLGMALGTLGFVCLAFASTVWLFVLGIVVFSIGEMTAHPKYYSYVGLVAPPDKKAVYMGYAFLYGVIGSLIGSTLGGAMYESLLKPFVGQPDVAAIYRSFWLTFAGIGGVAIAGLFLYNRTLSADTAATRRAARRVMYGVYAVLTILGAWFFYDAVFAGAVVKYKTVVQASIMLLLGIGGWLVMRRSK